jgi:hypothetical protein
LIAAVHAYGRDSGVRVARRMVESIKNRLRGAALGKTRVHRAYRHSGGGTTFDRWGTNPTGIFMFDRVMNYAQIIVGSESKVFGAKVACAFGTYSVDESQSALITHVTSSSSARLTGTTQSRIILSLTETELKYSNPLTSLGATAEVLWTRIG